MAKINKHALLKAFKSDLKAAETLKDDIDAKIQERRDLYNGAPFGNEEPGKSKIVPKVAKRQSEWAHATIKDPFVSTSDMIKCSPITFEDVTAARQSELLLNYQFCREFDRYNFFTKAIKVLDVDATLFVQTGWDYEDKEVVKEVEVVRVDEYGREFITKETTEDIEILVNKPTAKICRSEDIYVDPTCQDDLDKAQFVIYRYETDLSTLRKDGRYKNLDKVSLASSVNDDAYYRPEDTTNFEFKDDPRKKIIVYEYWGNYDVNDDGIVEPIVCAWVDEVIIRLQDNPYPDKKAPFIAVPFSSVPFQLHGENNLDVISDQQKVITAVTRGIINNMAQSTNGQVGLRKGALDPTQRKKFFAGKNFEFNGTQADVWQGSYNQIPGSAFDMLGLMNNEVESLTGTKGFSGGISGKTLGDSATAARGVLDATSVRKMDLVRNISENLVKPLMRKWMTYNSEFLSDEEVVRVTNSQFVPIKKDDLDGNIDIAISISTAEDNAAKSQELSFLLQTLGNSVPFELTQKVLAKIAKLSKQPDLEKEILDFKPQPDPAQEKIKQLETQKLQMEIEQIKAETARLYSNAKENAGDTAEKFAQARVKTAQAVKLEADAGKIKSETDLKNLEYIKIDNEVDTQRRREDAQMKHQMDLDKEKQKRMINLEAMQYQAKNNDHNIGIVK